MPPGATTELAGQRAVDRAVQAAEETGTLAESVRAQTPVFEQIILEAEEAERRLAEEELRAQQEAALAQLGSFEDPIMNRGGAPSPSPAPQAPPPIPAVELQRMQAAVPPSAPPADSGDTQLASGRGQGVEFAPGATDVASLETDDAPPVVEAGLDRERNAFVLRRQTEDGRFEEQLITGDDIAAAGGQPDAYFDQLLQQQRITPEEHQALMGAFLPQRPAARPRAARAPGEQTEVFEETITAQPSLAATAGAADADAAVRLAQKELELAEQEQIVAQQEAAEELSRRQAQIALRQQERADRIDRELRDRLGAVDQVMQAAASERVDPEAFYGGPIGRVASGVAIALGQIGAAIGGGENAAMRVVEQAAQRSVRAQMANQQAAGQAAGRAQNAFQLFRAITRDEQAAESLASAAELQAYETHLQGIAHGLRGPRLRAARVLTQRLAEARAAHMRVAGERARFTISRRIEAETPAPAAAPGRAAQRREAEQAGRDAGFAAGSLLDRLPAVAGADERAGVIAQAVGQAERAMTLGDYEGAGAAINRLLAEHGSELPLPERERLEGERRAILRTEAQTLGLRVAPGLYSGSPRARRAAQAAAEGRTGPGIRRTIAAEARRARGVQNDIDAMLLPDAEAQSDLQEHRRDAAEHAGFQDMPGLVRRDPTRSTQVDQFWRDAANRTSFYNRVDYLNSTRRLYNQLRAFRRYEGSNVIPSELQNRVQGAYTQWLEARRMVTTGAQASDAELERMLENYPDPTEPSFWEALRGLGIDNTLNRWNGIWEAIHNETSSWMSTRGLILDSAAGRAGAGQRARGRRRRRGRVRGPSDG